MKLEDSEIIAGDRIGNIYLGMTYEEFSTLYGDDDKSEEVRYSCSFRILFENFMVLFSNDEKKLDEITVLGDFKGKFRNIIGIGSTLSDVEKYIGDYYEAYEICPTYAIKDCDGICFELLDIDALTDDYIEYDYDSIEKLLPIEYITIFKGKP